MHSNGGADRDKEGYCCSTLWMIGAEAGLLLRIITGNKSWV